MKQVIKKEIIGNVYQKHYLLKVEINKEVNEDVVVQNFENVIEIAIDYYVLVIAEVKEVEIVVAVDKVN